MIMNESTVDSMGQKYIWAKTRAEIESEYKDTIKYLKGERASVNKLKGSKHYANWRLKSDSRQLKATIDHKLQYMHGLLDVHKERILEALAEGKPVPLTVLSEYHIQPPV